MDVFAVKARTSKGTPRSLSIVWVSSLGIRRHVKIRAAANPYMPEDAGYFWRRRHHKASRLLPARSAREFRTKFGANRK